MGAGTVFDTMMSEMLRADLGPKLLEDCMSFDVGIVSKIPKRYRLIALGFVKKLSLEEMNVLLSQQDCAKLYSRSLFEAGLIYAFHHGLSYGEWKKLELICEEVRAGQETSDPFFPGGSVTFLELRHYLEETSENEREDMATRHLTRVIERQIRELTTEEDFRHFLEENIRALTPVREKTRYYFCKYLYYFLEHRIGTYVAALRKGIEVEAALEGLIVFRGISALKRKKMTPEEARKLLEESAISCGAIFDELNYYYFEYVSLDWMEIQLEYYGDLTSLLPAQKAKLAASLRHYNRAYRKKTDDEILSEHQAYLEELERERDEAYSLEGENRGYQKNRAGENAVRKFLKGALDLDRTTLIAFLLFFGSELTDPAAAVSAERLTSILLECGFSGLRETGPFDDFVLRFLKSKEPAELLMEEVTKSALDEENFYLFRMYRLAESSEGEWKKLMEREG